MLSWYLRSATVMFLLITLLCIGLWVTGAPDASLMTALSLGVTLVGLWTTWVWSRLDRGDPPSSLFR